MITLPSIPAPAPEPPHGRLPAEARAHFPAVRFRFPRAAPATRLLVALALLSVGVSGGCQPTVSSAPRNAAVTSTSSKLTDAEFDDALNLLSSTEEFDSSQANLRVSYHLNKWLAGGDGQGEQFTSDPLIKTLPAAYQKDRYLTSLGSDEVKVYDVDYLETCQWAKSIGIWVCQQPLVQGFPSLAAATADLKPEARHQLEEAEKLFDWTIRNVQLEGVAPPQEQPASPPPSFQGASGAGYWLTLREAFLYGRGDDYHRMRVFIQLCRQRELDAVVLANRSGNQVVPWLVAVVINQQLYLFDPRLGLPVGVPQGEAAEGRLGIATLAAVRERPELLRTLNVGQEHLYQVPENLSDLVGLIDASPYALSQRMRRIEKRMTGAQRLALTVDASALKNLLEAAGVTDTRLWRVPLDAEIYRDGLKALFRREPVQEAQRAADLLLYPLHGASSLVLGRKLYFQGRFSRSEEGDDGAKTLYMEMRVPRAKLDVLETNTEVQREFRLEPEPFEPPDAFRERVRRTRLTMEQAMVHANYWLGIVQFETANYSSAEKWFHERTLGPDAVTPWKRGATYYLARTYEALQRIDDARQIYLTEESPQQHGNLLRARLLRQAHNAK